MAATGPVTSMSALARAALRAPLTRRARDELLFCLAGVLVGLAVLGVVVALLVPGTARSVIRATSSDRRCRSRSRRTRVATGRCSSTNSPASGSANRRSVRRRNR